MEYNEMLEILRGKRLHESVESIQQRLNEIADTMERLKRERDAAVADLEPFDRCKVCTYNELDVYVEPCASCRIKDGKLSGWKWRGVQDE